MIVIPAEHQANVIELVGSSAEISNTPWPCWDQRAIAFLSALSKALMKPALSAQLPDVVTVAFWLRASHLQKLQSTAQVYNLPSRPSNGDVASSAEPQSNSLGDAENPTNAYSTRLGLGLVVHICPANVPVNFLFSLSFALLAGNTSVLRLSSKQSKASTLIIETIAKLLQQETHSSLRSRILLMRYDHNDAITAALFSQADGRIIWGGDSTISYMRQFPIPSRSREIAFADRYSLAVLCPAAVLALDAEGLTTLAQKLFNDVMLMDQAACSSPQLFIWLSQDSELVRHAQQLLWPALAAICQTKQALTPIGQMDKLLGACQLVLAHDEISAVRHENSADSGVLTRISLSRLPKAPEQLRGYFGTLIEIQLSSLEPLADVVNERYQTLCYFGVPTADLQHWLLFHGFRGIDRIVPVGQAINMDLYWDGYDLISSLSRGIEIR